MSSKERNSSLITPIIKGVVLQIIIVLVAVLVFSLIVKIFALSNGAVKLANQIIKALSVLFACLFSVKESKGLVKGALIGGIGCVLTQLIFLLISGSFSFLALVLDVIFGIIVGGLSGIVSVNVSSKNN